MGVASAGAAGRMSQVHQLPPGTGEAPRKRPGAPRPPSSPASRAAGSRPTPGRGAAGQLLQMPKQTLPLWLKQRERSTRAPRCGGGEGVGGGREVSTVPAVALF